MKINAKSISFQYDSHPILQNISFSFEEGDVVGILGPNGAGKTTLLKILDKILKPKTGVINLDEDILGLLSNQEIAKKIGYIPQTESNQFPATVFNSILMGRKPYFSFTPSKDDLEITAQIICRLGLANISSRNIAELSGGQRQKVVFGRVLAQNPDIFLLDEPTANLDLKHQMEILSLLKNLAQKDLKIILIAIHDINLALKYCTKFIFLSNGIIQCAGKKEIVTEEIIEKVYEVKVDIFRNEEISFIIPQCPIKGSLF